MTFFPDPGPTDSAPGVPTTLPAVEVRIEAVEGEATNLLRKLIDDLEAAGHKVLHIATTRHWIHG